MRPLEAINNITPDARATLVYGEPYETPDGTTVIAVARVRTRRRGRGEQAGEPQVMARPVGIFTIRDGNATFEPAVDATRVALLGEVIGLVAATLFTAAMLRRPPWPDIHIRHDDTSLPHKLASRL